MASLTKSRKIPTRKISPALFHAERDREQGEDGADAEPLHHGVARDLEDQVEDEENAALEETVLSFRDKPSTSPPYVLFK